MIDPYWAKEIDSLSSQLLMNFKEWADSQFLGSAVR
jgi:hypothetical protein